MEKQIETYLRDKVKKHGGLALKLVSPGFTGIMDRMLLIQGGLIVFVETKAKGKNLKPRQAYVKRQFEALGFRCEKIDSKEQVDNLIKEIYGNNI